MKKKHVIVWVSSVTGNTKLIAGALIKRLRERGYEPLIKACSMRLEKEIRDEYQIAFAEEKNLLYEEKIPLILCFWCRRGSMDDQSLAFLREISGKKVLVFGTMGSYPESEYGQLVRKAVREIVEERNCFAGLFLCRGKIDPTRTEKRRKLSKNHRHYLDDESYARHLSSRSHPDETDVKEAVDFLDKKLEYILM